MIFLAWYFIPMYLAADLQLYGKFGLTDQKNVYIAGEIGNKIKIKQKYMYRILQYTLFINIVSND